jgi:histidinol phosphatase-like PHP family hydrolase
LKYLYETHLHTSPASACADSSGVDYVQAYIDQGYTGIFVTDHFFNGNTALPRNLPWPEWVRRFCQGYEEAKNRGDKLGLDVFFGWEETFDPGDDYLIFGLDREWLLEHPEVRHWTRGEQYRAVKAAGGCVVQAHPFRERDYIKKIVLSAGCVDAVEIANSSNHLESFDALAMRYAQRLGLPATAGSDAHDVQDVINGDIFGIYLDARLNSPADLVHAILNNQISGLKIYKGRCHYRGTETISLPLEVRDARDKVVNKKLEDMI